VKLEVLPRPGALSTAGEVARGQRGGGRLAGDEPQADGEVVADACRQPAFEGEGEVLVRRERGQGEQADRRQQELPGETQPHAPVPGGEATNR
jgi:hypothetical protein